MTVRKPLKESAEVNNDAVLSGEGADVGTSVLDEDDVFADINGEDGESFTEDGGEDTGTEVDDISDAEIDSMLNEADEDDDEDDEDDKDKKDGDDADEDDKDGDGKDKEKKESQIDNLGDKRAPPFKKEDGGKKKEAEGDDEDGKKDDDKKDGKDDDDGKDKVEEDFDDPGEIIDPVLYADDEPVVEEFGAIPDVVPELPDEPVVDLGEDDGSELDVETGVSVPSYEVETPFVLPESKRVVVAKGDVIFYCGKAKKDIPSFAESTFSQAVKLLVKSKNLKGSFLNEGKKGERVALIGRSCLVEVARDWRMPGTETIFEKGDILQIVSRKQVMEKEVKRKK